MTPQRLVPSAQPIVIGLSLVFGVAPALVLLGVLSDIDSFFSFLAFVAGSIGMGYLIRGAWAFFTSYDAAVTRYLGEGAAGALAPSSGATANASRSAQGPTAAEMLAGPPILPATRVVEDEHRPVLPPLPQATARYVPPAEPPRIIAPPAPPFEDDI